MNKEQGIKREFIHGCYTRNKYNREEDCVFVKEIIHYPDGSIKRQLTPFVNYPVEFYVTKPEFRNHKQKKEYEFKSKLNKHTCNRAQLPRKAKLYLTGKDINQYVKLSEVKESPYLYGVDITTPVLIHEEYTKKYPDLFTPSTLAVLDYETDVVRGTGEIISGVLAFKENVLIVVTKVFLEDLVDTAEEKILEALSIHLKDYIKTRNIKFDIRIVDKPVNVVIEIIRQCHKLQPDYVGIWNNKFDMTKMLEALELEGIDPAHVFSDPSVPNEYKYFNWRLDTEFKIKSNGERMKKHISELWNVASFPATFQIVCMMATFRHIRARDQQRTSYKLDSVLHDYMDLGKLKFAGMAEGLSELDWHIYMQKYHKIEYMVYMAFDGIGCELLDDKTGDVTKMLRGAVGLSEFSKTKSNPSRLADDCSFFAQESNKVLACTSEDMSIDLDELLPSLRRWIITLPADLVDKDITVNLINEYPLVETNISTHCFDSDVRSAYPWGEIILNVGKGTCAFSLCAIDGFSEFEQRQIGINMTHVPGNALMLARDCFEYPDLDLLLIEFIKEISLVN